MRSTCIAMAIMIGLSSGGLRAEDETDWRKEKPDSIKKWTLAIQEVAAKYGKGSTKAESDTRRQALVDEIAETFEGSVIEFKIRIREVKWKDGVAEVFTLQELPLPKSPTPAMPLRITRLVPFEFNMDQEIATKVKPGEWLTFKGRLKFHPDRSGAVGKDVDAQQLYDLRHEYLGTGYLGTFTTTEYECQIGRDDVSERWLADKSTQAEGTKP